MAVSRIARGKDWSGNLHRSCNALEAAADRLVRATPGETAAALKVVTDARKSYGVALLDLDRQRRPGIHAVAAG